MSSLSYKPITTIQIKRSQTAAGLAAHILQEGELCWDMENNQLAVGDGSTPGGIVLNVGVTPAIHYLANTSNMGSYHQFPGDVVAGMFLRSGSNSTEIGDPSGGQGYMTFLDFYHIEKGKRRHDILEHGSSPFSIFYTADETFSVDGTSIDTFQVFDGTDGYSGATTDAYAVRALNYDTTSMISDMTSTNSTFSLTVTWDATNSVPVLDWRRLDSDIIDFGSISHDLMDHTSSVPNSIIYADDSGIITSIPYSGGASGYVLKINDSTELEFGRQRWKDITGYLKFSDFTGNEYIGKPLFRVYDTSNGQWSPFDFQQWFFGDTRGVSGMPNLGGDVMIPGESIAWLYGQPENIYGYTPGESGSFTSTNGPYFSGARLKVSSWDKRVWGDLRTDSIDLNKYSGIARIEVESIHSSYMRLKTRNYSFNIGLHDFEGNVGDSSSITKDEAGNLLTTYVGKATDRKLVMGVTRGKHLSVAMYNRNTTVGNDISAFGSTSTNNDPDFQFDRYGMMHVYKAYMHDDNTSIYEEIGPLDYPTCVLYSGYGSHDVVNSTVRDVYGVYIDLVKKEMLSMAADGGMKTYFLACPSIVSSVSSGGPSMQGETGGLSIGGIDAGSIAYGVNITSIESDFDGAGPGAYGLKIGSIKSNSAGARGILIQDITGDTFTQGLTLLNMYSATKASIGIKVGDYSSGDPNISNYGIWVAGDITSNPTDWTGASSGTKYAIQTEAAAGTVRFMGTSWLQGNVIIGDPDDISATDYANYADGTFYGSNTFIEGKQVTFKGSSVHTGDESNLTFARGDATAKRTYMTIEADAGYVSGRLKLYSGSFAHSAETVITTDVSFWAASTTKLLLTPIQGGIIRIAPSVYDSTGSTYAVVNIAPTIDFEKGTHITFLGSYNGGSGKSMQFTINNRDTSSYDVLLRGSSWDSTNGSMLTLTLMDWTCSDGSVKTRWVETART